jgi:hypothetical protein
MEQLKSALNTETKIRNDSIDNSAELYRRLNSLIKPASPVTPDNAHIRMMYMVSDRINDHGGRFSLDDLSKLIDLVPGAPVLVGHRRDRLPVARAFHADHLVDDDGINWIRTYFYWMKEADTAMQPNIDSGIYRECSLCFNYSFPECSVCGDDIRRCPHVPLESYTGPDGSQEVVFYYYRGVNRIVEISLVYRGANPDTKITPPGKLTPVNSPGFRIKAASAFGDFVIDITSDGDAPLKTGRQYHCRYLGKGSGPESNGYKHLECSAFLEIADGVPKTLYIDDSILRGFYSFIRMKSDGRYRLVLRREA